MGLIDQKYQDFSKIPVEGIYIYPEESNLADVKKRLLPYRQKLLEVLKLEELTNPSWITFEGNRITFHEMYGYFKLGISSNQADQVMKVLGQLSKGF